MELEKMIDDFLEHKNYWFTDAKNSMFGKKEKIKKFLLTFDKDTMQCGEDDDDFNLIHAEAKFKDFYLALSPLKKQIIDEVWVIVTKDGKMIAKGTLKEKVLAPINVKSRKRILTYTSKGVAENIFPYIIGSCYGLKPNKSQGYTVDDLVATKATLNIVLE